MMPSSPLQICLVFSFVILFESSTGQNFDNGVIGLPSQIHNFESPPFGFLYGNEIGRIRRQDPRLGTTTTTPKPRKHRPSNIFSLISVLLTETREDANRAFNEIGTLFNSQFVNETAQGTSTTTTTTTTTTSATDTEDATTDSADEDEDDPSTTEPFKISRDEFFGVLRSNVQGLIQLFGKEFQLALRDSNKNVKEFGRDLKNAIWPKFSGSKSTNSTK